MKILLTLGATMEPIDGVRFITNFSSGKTGAGLADFLASKKHDVLALCGYYSAKPEKAKMEIYQTFVDLNNKLKTILARKNFDIILHLAAVSDYSVDNILIDGKKYPAGKIPKINSSANLEIKLKKNFKILDKIPSYAKNTPLIVGFKLTNGANKSEIKKAIAKVKANIVVHNDLKEIKKNKHTFYIYKTGKLTANCKNAEELANIILKEKIHHAARA